MAVWGSPGLTESAFNCEGGDFGDMTTFNWGNLSPFDFESLCRDLLSKVEGVEFRAFAPGRDGGVDLRAWVGDSASGSIVVQCKHMAKTPFAGLMSKIRLERAKLDRMVPPPARYILATTQALTEGNVQELYEELAPLCRGTEDILDVIRIEQLLEPLGDVVRAHSKLWFSSAPVLERLLYAATFTNSAEFVAQAQRSARTFVQPRAIGRAREILRREHSCVISGAPGVGKTTLAAMLALEYLAQDFQVILVEEDIREADALYKDGATQIFLYDDFLGRTDPWQKLGKNEDSRIMRFMNRVRESPNHRFILTTREYILRSVSSRYENLSAQLLDDKKCVLEMAEYSIFEKGLILYNHLYFTDTIPEIEIQDMIDRRTYRDVVSHPNYTPRHIADALASIGRRREQGIAHAD